MKHSLERDEPSIFEVMGALAKKYDAINLAQGIPDFSPPAVALEAAGTSIRSGGNGYSSSIGMPGLRNAIANHGALAGHFDPDHEITVVAGATEGLLCALKALTSPGDEVLVALPCYDFYPALIALAGCKMVGVKLREEENGLMFDKNLLEEALTSQTRVLLVNSPHNPSGHVLRKEEADLLADIAVSANLILLCDEVYEHFCFDRAHISLGCDPRVRARTVVVCAASKTFNLPGWRVGWVSAHAPLTRRIRTVHAAMTFCAPSPLQVGVQAALAHCASGEYLTNLKEEHEKRRDLMVRLIEAAGWRPLKPAGGFFIIAQAPEAFAEVAINELCIDMTMSGKVAALPIAEMSTVVEANSRYARFMFSRDLSTLEEAGRLLSAYTHIHNPHGTHRFEN
ncbi:pyridoxal phosphate-dependent aminotransferase [Pseudomonas syringae group genomosp. 3]|uniref:pyridoxal phosphate-dependent aminotransferase n=1 Tax=Pseudomonas syringae group genomosp. 3 TaxID=251701 RepID=UPI000708EA44|nr:aminotransferase class I/II-fold pyridoxal phosphate-dependent enzyme [Pseudomonas syringae group genomosp. 3]